VRAKETSPRESGGQSYLGAGAEELYLGVGAREPSPEVRYRIVHSWSGPFRGEWIGSEVRGEYLRPIA